MAAIVLGQRQCAKVLVSAIILPGLGNGYLGAGQGTGGCIGVIAPTLLFLHSNKAPPIIVVLS